MLAVTLSVFPMVALAQKPPAAPSAASVHAEAATREVTCDGAPAEVQGNRNTLTFKGACRGLTLRGDANNIDIDLATRARIDIEGNGNRLRYTVAGGGDPPTVRISGSDTDLSPRVAIRAPAPTAATPVRLSGDNQRLDVDCAGRDVDIQGNRSRYTLRGGCRSLSVHGDANTLQATLRPGARVEIEGNGTVLDYRIGDRGTEEQEDADVTIRGTASRATREGHAVTAVLPAPAVAPTSPPPAARTEAPAPAPSVPSAADASNAGAAASVPQLMHDLGASVVEAGTSVPFKADLLFDGATDTPHGDAPGRLSALTRLIQRTHPSAVRITGTDPANTDLAQRRAQVVATWLKDHGIAQPIATQAGTGDVAGVTVLLAR